MLKFYYNPISINARRVWIALLEKQIPFEPVLINLDGDQLQPEFMAINPLQRIPVIIDDGFKVVESLAILDYLEAKYPTPKLIPDHPEALAVMRMVQLVAVNEIQTATMPLTMVKSYLGFYLVLFFMSQQNLLELAKQGDVNAIATLINQALQPQGITAKASIKNGCLQIMLEAQPAPDQQVIVSLIYDKLVSLDINSFNRVKIYGRETGDDFPDWQQELNLVSSTPEETVEVLTSTTNQPSESSSLVVVEHQTQEITKTEQPSFLNSWFGAVAGAAGVVAGAAANAGSSVTGAVVGAAGVVAGASVQAGQAVAGAAVGVGGALGSTAAKAGSNVTGAAEVVVDATVQTGQVVVEKAIVVGGAIGSAAVKTGTTVTGALTGAAGAAGGIIGSATAKATEGVGLALDVVSNNHQLQRLIQALPQADWLLKILNDVDIVKAETDVRRLQQKYPNEQPSAIAHRVMIEKALLAGGMGFTSSLVPGAATALLAVDLFLTATLQAEMVYQIACAYGFDLQEPARKGEVLAIFGLSVGGSQALKAGGSYAIKAGLSFLENIPVAGAVIGASTNVVMIYALGYAACRFYEAKNQPLIMEATLIEAEVESQKYLEAAIDQQVVMDQILVHIILAGNPGKTWAEILPEIQTLNLSPASLDAIAANIESPPPLEILLSQINSDFAIPLLAQCQKIAQLDGITTPEEAEVIETINKKFNINLDSDLSTQ